MLGKIKGRRREREDEMAGWHHQCNGHELGQTLGGGKGQGGLACCSPWGQEESDTTGRLNNDNARPSYAACRTISSSGKTVCMKIPTKVLTGLMWFWDEIDFLSSVIYKSVPNFMRYICY